MDPRARLGCRAKLTDFGLALTLDVGATHVSNYRAGTMFFMAPEVAHHARMTRACDIYSLGVVMWCLLTGRDPWVVAEDGGFAPNPEFPGLAGDVSTAWGAERAYVRGMNRCVRVGGGTGGEGGKGRPSPSAAAACSTAPSTCACPRSCC